MRVRKDTFLVEVSNQFVQPNIPGLNFIDTAFNPKLLATKIGVIHTLPIIMTDQYIYDIPLKEGDVVVFDHNVCSNQNKYSDTLFFCDYFNIFAKIEKESVIPPGLLINVEELEKIASLDNEIKDAWIKLYKQTGVELEPINDSFLQDKIIPLEDVFFSQPIIDKGKTIGCFNVPDKVSDKKALVYEVSNFVKAAGVEKGDIVFFTKNADYPMQIGGKDFYKMHLRNVIGIERNGELVPYSKKLLIKNTTKLGMVGGLERIYASNTLQTGVVLHSGTTDIPKGSTVTYFNGMSSAVNWKEEDYSFVNLENIKWYIH